MTDNVFYTHYVCCDILLIIFIHYFEARRLLDIVIGLTNDPPIPGRDIMKGSYDICGVYGGDVSESVIIECMEGHISGRYLILHKPNAHYGLNLCEVEVHSYDGNGT